MTADCQCDLTHVCQSCLETAWHAANPGVRPTPWEASRPRIIIESPILLGPAVEDAS